MAGVHSILSPSSAHRWLVCTPSARFEEQIPEEESVYAAEGTLAHDLAALLLLKANGQIGDMDAYEEAAREIQANELYSVEMLEHCQAYADYVTQQAAGEHIYIEHSYDMSKYIPLQFGTCDASFIRNGVIHVIDFKYGAGVRVSATGNKQMMCYGLGAYDYHGKGYTLSAVNMAIYQPRVGGVSSWELPIEELLTWAEDEARPKGNLAIAGGGDFVAGDHCRFCKSRTRCKAFYDMFASMRNISDSREMTDKQRAEVLTNGGAVKSWIEAVSADTLKTLEGGGLVPGFKLVAGDGKRSYKSEDDVVDILLGAGLDSGDIFDAKLYPITKLEKQLGKKRFNELLSQAIIKIPGKPQIAPESDERPAIGATAADEYDNEEDLTV